MVNGDVKRGELALFKNNDGEILCKIVGHFPMPTVRELTGVLRVRTDKDRLLLSLDDKDEII